ncbi:MAG: AAA family ATPase [Proteobacteria bacterium]|nr:AAA family ATPase [Pseudomonadota bacterium]
MVTRLTKKTTFVRLSEKRIGEIKNLVRSWSYGTKAFMRARINQYRPPLFVVVLVKKMLFFLFGIFGDKKKFKILNDPEILTNWQKRFELSGEAAPQAAWNKILGREISQRDYVYTLSLLEDELADVHIPFELRSVFEKIYRAHIKKEYISDASVPRAPLVLITGTSGSGKTVTIDQAIEKVIFGNRVLLEVDLDQKKETSLEKEPFWKSIEEIDPDLAEEIERRKRRKLFRNLSKTPIVKHLFRRRIGRNLVELEEQGVFLDYSLITPNDYQTAYAGEPGNYLKKAFGNPKRASIRHIEEAHSAFGRVEGDEKVSGRQQRTLVDSSNILLDEIINGRRDCLLIASSDKPEMFDQSIYRRFVEKGVIIDISEYWKNPDNLKEIVHIELTRNDIQVEPKKGDNLNAITPSDLDTAVRSVVDIFKEKTLRITPSYVRKLIQSIIEIKKEFRPEFLENALLVRSAFELVAKNVYGDLFNKVVDKMDRSLKWEDYIGDIKNKLSEMANNCLYYGVNDEKGVVLDGPPGSGKTFLVRSWLSENKDMHDISASPNDLFNPSNPYDGAVQNLENLYDIAKMIAPSVVFFDEGDALAPKRSSGGGSPADKLTNKFLNLIDGEVPLNKVFTVLTTNRIDIMDPALIRSKRLKVLEISGYLREKDIISIVEKLLEKVPFAPDLDIKTSVKSAQSICNTPADYTAFVEKALSLRNTEYIVLKKMQELPNDATENLKTFARLNFKTLLGILDTVNAPHTLRSSIKRGPGEVLSHYDTIMSLVNGIREADSYPLAVTHIKSAREEISESPMNKGKFQLDSFLEAELSKEPQIGFIIGAGANELSGVLLPIATSLIYNFNPQKVLVTGAVSSPSSATAQMELAVKMTQQSAHEALTLVKNYLQNLMPDISITRLLGEFLDRYTIHHQLLSASYNVGGPSAGYALAINTLSAILQIAVYNDFGITGAPWTKGITKGEVGGSVIIGGHKKKSEKVLMYLRRMFMPQQNYKDLGVELLESYWSRDKDILEVSSFGDLIPEVVWLSPNYEKTLQEFISLRIACKLNDYHGRRQPDAIQADIETLKTALRSQLEKEIVAKLSAIKSFLNDPKRDQYLTLTELFKKSRYYPQEN